jgi:hypothetical protein
MRPNVVRWSHSKPASFRVNRPSKSLVRNLRSRGCSAMAADRSSGAGSGRAPTSFVMIPMDSSDSLGQEFHGLPELRGLEDFDLFAEAENPEHEFIPNRDVEEEV